MLLLADDRIDDACDRYAAAGKNQWGFDDATWRRLARELRDRQEQTAQRRGTIPYSDLVTGTAVADLDHWFHIIGDLLVVVADAAHEARLPMLIAVATKKAGDRPGGGFYDAARHFGELAPGTRNDDAFWIGELTKVHQRWRETRSV